MTSRNKHNIRHDFPRALFQMFFFQIRFFFFHLRIIGICPMTTRRLGGVCFHDFVVLPMTEELEYSSIASVSCPPPPLPFVRLNIYRHKNGRKGMRTHVMNSPLSYDHRPSHPHNAGTEHVGFSPTRQALPAPRAKRREAFGESHKR